MIWTENRTLKVNCSTPALAIGISRPIIAKCNSSLHISEKSNLSFRSAILKLIYVLSIQHRQYANQALNKLLKKLQVGDYNISDNNLIRNSLR